MVYYYVDEERDLLICLFGTRCTFLILICYSLLEVLYTFAYYDIMIREIEEANLKSVGLWYSYGLKVNFRILMGITA